MKLVVRDVAIERGDRLVVGGISFEVAAGEAVVLRGANGTGKTTLIRAIAGLLPLANGAIRLEGGRDEASVGMHCHYISHRNALKADLTVRENLLFWRDFYGSEGFDANAMAVAADVAGLFDIPVRYLSAGQQRRVALARLLTSQRPVWLLDEPTVSLDEAHTAMLARLANQHLDAGGLIVAATHTPLGFAQERVLWLGADRGAGEAA